MTKSILLLLIIKFYSCKDNTTAHLVNNVTAIGSKDSQLLDYNAFKDSVVVKKKLLTDHPTKEISDYFFNLINTDIYNHWKGTEWAFYGMTRRPNEGTIACGYFVTTTLCDVGLKIDRVRLAQCTSGEMIKELCVDIHTFKDFKKFKSFLTNQPIKSVFIVGLDYHTGYIIKDTSKLYFLHSNYIRNQGVVKEEIDSSAALINNKFFMIGSLTANEALLQKWISY
ncbi:hypothetical protein [Flavobacterium sp.]|uniref:hypothetical protein n=1 Tax=Flavobacterium sp. TaxID=239 RepID=UPI0026108587|nr:hypothetical protein [Flavobacterium sp.]